MESNNDIVSLVNQAAIALANRRYQDALKAYASALEIAKPLKRSRLLAVLLNRVGQVTQAQGKIQGAAQSRMIQVKAGIW